MAALVAPSPTRSRNRLGILKATKKASARNPVPRSFARTISRKKPKMRELKVPTERMDVDLIIERWESGPRSMGPPLWSDLLVDINNPFCYITRPQESFSLRLSLLHYCGRESF